MSLGGLRLGDRVSQVDNLKNERDKIEFEMLQILKATRSNLKDKTHRTHIDSLSPSIVPFSVNATLHKGLDSLF